MNNITGLNEEEVKERRKKYGSNDINGKNQNTFFSLFIETLGDPIIKILLIALAIKTIFLFRDFDYFETIGIVVAILVASLISAISEYGSNKAFQRMQEESSRINIKVVRGGNLKEIPISDAVVGDIIYLTGGDRVGADGIIIKGHVAVDESSLNGEAREIYKESTKDTALAEEKNRLYRGTTIYDGEAYLLTTKVGMDTLYGKMAKELSEVEDDSPLKKRLTNLAKIISRIGYISALLIAVSFLFSKIFIANNFNLTLIRSTITTSKFLSYLLEALTLAVSVLVMSVPEGLPMMITLVLSINSKKMLKDNVLVRKMVGIETAGCLNILFTDKTGTITKGKMEVVSFIDGSSNEYSSLVSMPHKYKSILIDSLIYNNESIYEEDSDKIIGGNLTDKALLKFASERRKTNTQVKDKVLFSSKNKFAITIIEKEGKSLKLIKGAPDKIIKHSENYLTKDGEIKKINKEEILKFIENKTKTGLRAIAISISQTKVPTDSLRHNTLVAVVFIKDELRSEAKDGLELITKAGIQTVMVTGDSEATAVSIAKEAGIITSPSDIVLTSSKLEKMTNEEIKKILPNLKVVARALPEDKKRLVMLSRELGLVTGMTGDGVNDSVALKKADVSFAIGSGTEVAKEASDIVVLDDNILSISKAILYGRTIFKNIRKFIIFQLTVNFSAVSLALIGPFVGVPAPITVIQMLWINMVMDTLAGLAFSYEVPRKEYMLEKPKKREESIINKYMLNEIIVSGIYSFLLCIFFLKSNFIQNMYENPYKLMTAFFSLFIFLAVMNAFNARTYLTNIFNHLSKNKVFTIIIAFIIIVQILIIYSGITIFRTTSLNIKEFLLILIMSSTIIPVDLVRKILYRRKDSNMGV